MSQDISTSKLVDPTASAAAETSKEMSVQILDPSTPIGIVQRFVLSVDNGNVRSELANDCILSLFGRNIKGAAAVAGYLRTQLRARFCHAGFELAQRCEPDQELVMKERFGRAFERLRRRLFEQQEKPPSTTTLKLRADSIEETVESQLVTPPRPASHNMEVLQYIQSDGQMEALHDGQDGGIDLGDLSQVRLTLGYRSGTGIEICLAMYEKYDMLTHTSTLSIPTGQRQRRRMAINQTSDDEGDRLEVARSSLSVRRTLFTTGDDEEPKDDDDDGDGEGEARKLKPLDTPRKRTHPESPAKAGQFKRATGRSGLRF